jgi:hypothetical protein
MSNTSFFKTYRFTLILLAIMVLSAIIVIYSVPSSKGAPELNASMITILLVVGLVAGLLGGWIGTGGCSVMLPILDFWLGFPPPLAVGTTLFAVIFTAVSGGYGHFKQNNLDKRVALWTGGAGIIGVLLGSWLFLYLSKQSQLLGFIIGIVFLWPSIRMIWEGLRGFKKAPQASTPQNGTVPSAQSIPGKPANLSVFGIIVGILTGLVGLGGGYALVPGFIYLFGAPVYITMGTSLAVMVPMAVVGGTIKLVQGYVYLGAALLLASGTIVGAQVGAATMKKIKPNVLKLIFGVYFLYVALKFIGAFLGVKIW